MKRESFSNIKQALGFSDNTVSPRASCEFSKQWTCCSLHRNCWSERKAGNEYTSCCWPSTMTLVCWLEGHCDHTLWNTQSQANEQCEQTLWWKDIGKSTKWFYSVPILEMVCLRYPYLHYIFVIHIVEWKCETVNSNIPIPGMDPQKHVRVQSHRALGKAVLHINTHTCTPFPSLEVTSLHFLFMLWEWGYLYYSTCLALTEGQTANIWLKDKHSYVNVLCPNGTRKGGKANRAALQPEWIKNRWLSSDRTWGLHPQPCV